MQDIQEKIRSLEFQVAKVKLEFERAITDTNTPLDVRWTVFMEAPGCLKNTSYSMCSEWDEYFCEDYVMYDGQYHVERHSFVNAAEVVIQAEENRDFWEDMENPWNFFDIDAAKEKILAANLLGAKYDW